jgi:hypothetical protein
MSGGTGCSEPSEWPFPSTAVVSTRLLPWANANGSHPGAKPNGGVVNPRAGVGSMPGARRKWAERPGAVAGRLRVLPLFAAICRPMRRNIPGIGAGLTSTTRSPSSTAGSWSRAPTAGPGLPRRPRPGRPLFGALRAPLLRPGRHAGRPLDLRRGLHGRFRDLPPPLRVAWVGRRQRRRSDRPGGMPFISGFGLLRHTRRVRSGGHVDGHAAPTIRLAARGRTSRRRSPGPLAHPPALAARGRT